jgi:hypothetical protein
MTYSGRRNFVTFSAYIAGAMLGLGIAVAFTSG